MAINKLPKLYSTDFRLPNKKPVGAVEIDWSNPLTKGLSACWTMDSGGSSEIDLVGGIAVPLVNGAFRSIESGRKSLNTTGSNAKLFINPIPEKIRFDGSVTLVSAFISSSYFYEQYLIGVDSATEGSSAGNCIYSLAINASGTLKNFWEAGTGANVIAESTVAPTIEINKWHTVAMSRTSNATSNVVFALNGEQVGAEVTGLTNATGGQSSPLVIGGLRSSSSSRFNGNIALTLIYNRGLSSAECKAITNNPYQILKPKQAPVYFTADAGGISVVESTQTLDIASQSPVINLTGTIEVVESAVTLDINTQNPSIDLTGSIEVVESTSTLNIASQDPAITLTATITIEESTRPINLTGLNPSIILTPPNTIVIEESTQSISLVSQDPIILFSGTITVEETTQTIDWLARKPIVTIGLPEYTQIFVGVEKAATFTGDLKLNSFAGTIPQEQIFIGTERAATFLGVIQ